MRRMKILQRLLRFDFIPSSVNLGLLALRLWLGLSLLLLHGWGKLSNYQQTAATFPDPLHVGTKLSLGLAIFGEAAGSVLIVLGLFARFGALACAINMAVAFCLVHKLALSGTFNGELAFVYLGGFVALFLAGPGRFSLDARAAVTKARGEKA